MKKQTTLLTFLVVLIVLCSCGPAPTDNPSSSSTEGDSQSLDTSNSESGLDTPSNTSGETSSTPPSTTNSDSSSGSVIETLTDDELSYLSTSPYYYGNTNGNAQNRGLAVYNQTAKLHYYAVGPSVYQYNPLNNVNSLLFTTSGTGSVGNLTLTTTDLYFVSTTDNYLQKYNFASQQRSVIFSNETNYVARSNNYIYANISKIEYEQSVTGLSIYRHSQQSSLTNFAYDATNVNISGNRLIFTAANEPVIQLMSDTFSGKTTVKSLSGLGFTEVLALQLLSETNSTPANRVFALLLKNVSETALYIYKSETDTLTKLVASPNIHSLNSNGTHLYFINNDSLYAYDFASESVSLKMLLHSNARYLQIINHWLYISNADRSSLYRIHPDTNSKETNFWVTP